VSGERQQLAVYTVGSPMPSKGSNKETTNNLAKHPSTIAQFTIRPGETASLAKFIGANQNPLYTNANQN